MFAVHLSSRLSDTYAHATEAARSFPAASPSTTPGSPPPDWPFRPNAPPACCETAYPPRRSRPLTALRRRHHPHAPNTLSYLQRSGRIGGAAALVGGLLNMKPIIGLRDGRVEPFTRALGTRRALNSMTEQLRACARELPHGRVAFFHNGAPDSVEALRFEARRLGVQESMTLGLGTVLSAHGGPGVFGFSFEPAKVWQNFRAY